MVAVIGSSARSQPEKSVKPLIDSASATRPLAAYLVPEAPEALAQLAAAGVPAFRTPEACADAVAAALRRRPPRGERGARSSAPTGEGRLLDELEAYALLDRPGIARAPAWPLDATSARRRRCRSPIRSSPRCCRPRSRTSPISAASRSASPTAPG